MNKKSILCIKYKTLSFFTADCLPFQCNQIKTILQNSKTTITTKQSCSLRGRLWGYTMMIMDQLDWMNCQGDLTKWLGVTFHPLASYLCQLWPECKFYLTVSLKICTMPWYFFLPSIFTLELKGCCNNCRENLQTECKNSTKFHRQKS